MPSHTEKRCFKLTIRPPPLQRKPWNVGSPSNVVGMSFNIGGLGKVGKGITRRISPWDVFLKNSEQLPPGN